LVVYRSFGRSGDRVALGAGDKESSDQLNRFHRLGAVAKVLKFLLLLFYQYFLRAFFYSTGS